MRKISDAVILVLFLFFGTRSIPAMGLHSETATITGVVVNRENQEPLAGANVFVEGDTVGCLTDGNGRFLMALKSGAWTIRISFIGFEPERRRIHAGIKPSEMPIRIRLSPKVLKSEPMTIEADRAGAKASTFRIESSELREMAAPLPEPLLQLRTLPGIGARNDQSSFYSVRGGGYDENVIYLNGVEIEQPHIVRKGYLENPSLVNPTLVRSLNLLTGAFPVSFGDRLSSVLDVAYAAPAPGRPEFGIDCRITGINAGFRAAVGEHAGIVLASRRIDYGYLYRALRIKGDYSPDYRDVQGVLSLKPSSQWRIELLGILARSRFLAEPTEESSAGNFTGSVSTNYGNDAAERFGFDNGTVSLKWAYRPKPSISITGIHQATSQTENQNTDFPGMMIRYQPSPSEPFSGSLIVDRLTDHRFTSRNFRSQWTFQFQPDERRGLLAGVEWKGIRWTSEASALETGNLDNGGQYIIPSPALVPHAGRRGGLVSAFAEWNQEFTPFFRLQSGLRWTVDRMNRERMFMPRFRFQFRPSSTLTLEAAFGKFCQPPVFREFLYAEPAGKRLKSQKSRVWTLGLENKFGDGWSLKWEAYHKSLSDLISYDIEDVWIRYSGENDATGYAAGMDVYLSRSSNTGRNNWVSYSYLVTREKLKGSGLGFVSRPTDRRHQLAFTLDDKMKDNPNSRIHIRIVWGSGYPYTYRSINTDAATGLLYIETGARNDFRIPFYGRCDLGFTQRIRQVEGFTVTFREEILNLFNQRNVLDVEFVNRWIVKHYLSGLTVNLGMEANF
jgi:hypothetical protein